MTDADTTAAALEKILTRAAGAVRVTRHTPAATRASWLRAVADALDAACEKLVRLAIRETHLSESRLRGELLRTTFQARFFADRLESSNLLQVQIDQADPDWPMGPRPDLRRTHVPIGPVLVFAASNFPFAFSVAGGDSISALAAGCPVVVKAHPGHPDLSRAASAVVGEALLALGAPDGTFSLIEGEQAGVVAVQDPRIKAVSFTGSTAGGRALFDLAVGRPDPIPFYGELGSTNPVVVTEQGWSTRGAEIASGFAGSMTLGAGQFCTKPGVVFVPDATGFVDAMPELVVTAMLNDRIRDRFKHSLTDVATRPGVEVAAQGVPSEEGVRPTVLRTTTEAVMADPSIVTTEMFGPAAVICEYDTLTEVCGALELFGGSLTATVQGGDEIDGHTAALVDLLTEHAGRVIWNQWPTGLTVSDAQHHGGPWPATTSPTSTSVGSAAIQRFLRPVAYQNLPVDALPAELRD